MERLIQTIEKLKFDPTKELIKLISDSGLQEWVLNVIKEKQLFEQGVGESNIIIGYYSPYTEQLNPDKKANTHFTLRDTGEFYNTIKIIIIPDGFIIDGDGQKEDKNLFEVYGKEQNLLGFTEKNFSVFIELIGKKTLEEINKR